jgi:hypothetical protein
MQLKISLSGATDFLKRAILREPKATPSRKALAGTWLVSGC